MEDAGRGGVDKCDRQAAIAAQSGATEHLRDGVLHRRQAAHHRSATKNPMQISGITENERHRRSWKQSEPTYLGTWAYKRKQAWTLHIPPHHRNYHVVDMSLLMLLSITAGRQQSRGPVDLDNRSGSLSPRPAGRQFQSSWAREASTCTIAGRADWYAEDVGMSHCRLASPRKPQLRPADSRVVHFPLEGEASKDQN
jgi:hypothetical protein